MYAGWLAGSVRSDCRVMMVMMIGCSALSPRQICAEDGIFRGICADYELGRHLIKYFNSLRALINLKLERASVATFFALLYNIC
jgi:hypothetical protein